MITRAPSSASFASPASSRAVPIEMVGIASGQAFAYALESERPKIDAVRGYLDAMLEAHGTRHAALMGDLKKGAVVAALHDHGDGRRCTAWAPCAAPWPPERPSHWDDNRNAPAARWAIGCRNFGSKSNFFNGDIAFCAVRSGVASAPLVDGLYDQTVRGFPDTLRRAHHAETKRSGSTPRRRSARPGSRRVPDWPA